MGKEADMKAIGRSLAKSRDMILLAALSGEIDRAREILEETRGNLQNLQLSAFHLNETTARLLESELDISENKKGDIIETVHVLIKINDSECFSAERKKAVLRRGLLSVIGKL